MGWSNNDKDDNDVDNDDDDNNNNNNNNNHDNNNIFIVTRMISSDSKRVYGHLLHKSLRTKRLLTDVQCRKFVCCVTIGNISSQMHQVRIFWRSRQFYKIHALHRIYIS